MGTRPGRDLDREVSVGLTPHQRNISLQQTETIRENHNLQPNKMQRTSHRVVPSPSGSIYSIAEEEDGKMN
ncbi:hypothetical protein STEG23_013333 [Scotinomys teguina]